MKPAFHIYIDEAGDPGVKAKTGTEPHWTDWFVMSAVVVSDENDKSTVEWIQEMNKAIRRNGSADIHYRKLSDTNRNHVCRVLSEKPVRVFVVASHKDSMRNHESKALGRATDKKFYNWCLRILLERVTEWCARRCVKEGLPISPARFVFSERGGHDYDDLRAYLTKVEAQTLTGNLVLNAKGITPGIIYQKYCEVIPHSNLAGLQLADIAASAFFQASCSPSPRHSLDPATRLVPRLARKAGKRTPDWFGIMLLPFPKQGDIPDSDKEIFRRCGYFFRKR